MRWADIDKGRGGAQDVDYRYRLAGRELNVRKDDSLYASTPQLEARSLIVSHAATHAEDARGRLLMINGVRRACVYVSTKLDVYIELRR